MNKFITGLFWWVIFFLGLVWSASRYAPLENKIEWLKQADLMPGMDSKPHLAHQLVFQITSHESELDLAHSGSMVEFSAPRPLRLIVTTQADASAQFYFSLLRNDREDEKAFNEVTGRGMEITLPDGDYSLNVSAVNEEAKAPAKLLLTTLY